MDSDVFFEENSEDKEEQEVNLADYIFRLDPAFPTSLRVKDMPESSEHTSLMQSGHSSEDFRFSNPFAQKTTDVMYQSRRSLESNCSEDSDMQLE